MRQYIQIPTDIILSDWWQKNEVCRTLYIELSQRASYRETAELSAGCCFFGRVSFAQKYGYTETKVRTALKILVKNGAIKITPNHTKSIVEVLYISEFLKQKNDQPNNQLFNQPNSQPNDHKHNSITYNSITGNLQEESIGEKSPSRSKFRKPTLQELIDYAQEKKLIYVDCESFLDFYESNGWKVGRNAMKDWRAALRKWNRTTQNTNNQQFNNKNYGNNQNSNRRNGLTDEEVIEAVNAGFALARTEGIIE